MTRGIANAGILGVATVVMAVTLPVAAQAPRGGAAGGVTFTKDVAPILYARCVSCHRPNEMAPMALRTYQEVRPWARAIRQRVLAREMPPWFADPAHGEFANDARLPDAEVETIAKWVDAGAPKGDDRDLPPMPAFTEGWTIGEPDVVLNIPEHDVPAQGVIPYTYFTVPTNFTEDQWVVGMEIRPGNRQVVHHVIVSVLEPGVEGPPQGATRARVDVIRAQLGGITPNKPGFMFREGTGKLLKPGSKLVFQMHYTPVGEAVKDRTRLGLKLARNGGALVPMRTAIAINNKFVIPPGDPAYEVRATATVSEDIHVHAMTPHMHFRGKDFTYTAVYPDGRSEVLLRVPNYDFNWQLTYNLKTPLALPMGTRIECVAHFDNSSRNPANPDPKAEVRWGDQTFEEMMIGFYSYTRDADRTRATAGAREER